MIIDCILDRKDGFGYSASGFYAYLLKSVVDRIHADMISRAMDFGTNKDVQEALCKYILDNGYDDGICNYVRDIDWLSDERRK